MLRKFIALTAVGLALAGCGLEAKVTTYQQLPDSFTGTRLAVRAARADREGSLEFAAFQRIIAQHFADKGFMVVDRAEDATWIALLDYGVDNGTTTTSTSTTPIYGTTGGGLQTTNILVPTSSGSKLVTTSGFAPSTYGVVGVSTSSSSSTRYQRIITLDIVDKSAPAGAAPHKLYEAKLQSEGGCSVMSIVFPVMADALFKEWPGKNGGTVKVNVPASGSKC